MNPQNSPEPNYELAQLYDDHFVGNILAGATELLLDVAAPKPAEQVLDVACGTGIVARHVASRIGNKGGVTGLDIDPAMLAVARQVPPPTGAPLFWREGDAHALPFKNGRFDLVLCQHGLQYFHDPLVAVKEMRRVLKPVGRLAVSVLASLDHNPFFQLFDQHVVKRLGTSAFGYAFAFGGPDRMESLLVDAKCHDVTVVQRTHNAAFPSAHILVQTSLLRSTVVQEMLKSSQVGVTELIDALIDDMAELFERHTVYNRIVFPVNSLIGRAGR